MKKSFFSAILFTVISLAGVRSALAQTALTPDKQASAKVAALLEESGHAYTKGADNVWAIHFQGKQLGKFNVVASVQQDILVVFAIVAEKKQLRLTPESLTRLLKFNHQFDRVKVGLDDEGDAFVRIDLSLRVLDVQELKDNLEQVAAAADEVFAGMKTFITPAK